MPTAAGAQAARFPAPGLPGINICLLGKLDHGAMELPGNHLSPAWHSQGTDEDQNWGKLGQAK